MVARSIAVPVVLALVGAGGGLSAQPYTYAAKFVCGPSSESDDEGVVRGRYGTAINIHNPTGGVAPFFKKFARALPNQVPGPVSGFELGVVQPGEAIEVECDEIRKRLPWPVAEEFRTGYVVLRSLARLDVTAVYTARPAGAGVRTVETDAVEPRQVACEPGWTGDLCSIECRDGAECHALVTRNWDGSVNGIRMFGSILHEGLTADAALAGYLEFVAAHAPLYGLDPVNDPAAFAALEPSRSFAHRTLRIRKYDQAYRGLPVAGPGSELVLTVAPPYGVVTVTGTLVDQRVDYDGTLAGVVDGAAASQRVLDLWGAEGPGGTASVASLELVAMPLYRALGYRALVAVDGAVAGTVVIQAAVGSGLPLVALSEHRGFEAEPVTVRAREWDQFRANYPGPSALFDTTRTTEDLDVVEVPLTGTAVDTGLCAGSPDTCVRLGTARSPLYDYGGNPDPGINQPADPASATLLTDPGGSFPAGEAGPPSTTFRSQSHYHKLRAALDVLDRFKEERWEWSASLDLGPDDVPQLAFLANVSTSQFGGLFTPPTFDAGPQQWLDAAGTSIAPGWDALAHPPQLDAGGDVVPPSAIRLNIGNREATLYHEIGHYIDWFTGSGIGYVLEDGSDMHLPAPSCVTSGTTACCRQDTSDEAPPLAESIGSLFTTYFARRLHDLGPQGQPVTFPQGSLPAIPFDVVMPGEGAAVTSTWRFTGQRPLLGGRNGCLFSVGYRQAWLLQSFWEFADGVVCDIPASLTGGTLDECPTFEVTLEQQPVSPADAELEALLYALQKQPPSGSWYRQLVDDMGEYLECVYGPPVFAAFSEIYGDHGLAPAAPVPRVCPPICGFNGLEPGEACEGDDLGGNTCAGEGFDGGTLACFANCTLDTSGCHLCGNDVREPGEACDGEDFGGQSCVGFGFDGGTLACSDDCQSVLTDDCVEEPDEPEDCFPGDEDCTCAATFGQLGQESAHPDGDHAIDEFCPDDGDVELTCVSQGDFGVCTVCNEGGDRHVGCSCTDDEQCAAGLACWGADTQDGAGTGHCYDVDDGPPSWICIADCQTLFNSELAFCLNDHIAGEGFCLDGACGAPLAFECWTEGEIPGLDEQPSLGPVCRFSPEGFDGSDAACVSECGPGADPDNPGLDVTCQSLGYPAIYECDLQVFGGACRRGPL